MKRWIYLVSVIFSFRVSAQSFPVKNVNDEYFVSSIYNPDFSKKELHEFVRDKSGLYWFQYFNEVVSFDGANWKSYKLRSMNGSANPFRLSEIEVTDDGNIWLGTENGFYVFDPASACFVSLKEKFPNVKDIPPNTNCTFPGPPGKFIFLSFGRDGFFVFDVLTQNTRHIVIDSTNRAYVSTEGQQITTDRIGNIWGTTQDRRGIWQYNLISGKLRCSWKGELPSFAGERFKNFINLTYAEKDNILWIGHVNNRYVEKMNLHTGKSIFYSFTGDLLVRADTNSQTRLGVFMVKIDRDYSEWINVAGKYLVKLNNDISRMEYLTHDKNMFPVGEFQKFKPETAVKNDRNNILFWVAGFEKLSMIRKRDRFVRHVYFDTLSTAGINPEEYINTGRQSTFFEKGKNGSYFLLQQNPGRAKVVCLGRDMSVNQALFNDKWKEYPAYFGREYQPDSLFIAILRPGTEPLNFRDIVLKDFQVDLHTLKVKEIQMDFSQRVWRYGSVDIHNVRWLFSNGYLYSYDPSKGALDSIFICRPASKGSHSENLIKGYNYPTALHKSTSTFWISFYPVRELYKINLITRKIDKILRPCMDRPECKIPGVVYNMYTFDSSNLYLKSSLHAMLLNARTDSITGFSELFHKQLPAESPVGAGIYRNWICLIFPSHVYLLNKVSAIQRELHLEEDFKWRITSFMSNPLLNDSGEMILMSAAKKGFLLFNIDSPFIRTKPGKVNLTYIKVDDREVLLDSLGEKSLVLKYNDYHLVRAAFSDHSVFVPGKTAYEYSIFKGGDTVWNRINGNPEISISELSPGKYKLLLRASNLYGDYSEETSSLNIEILPLFRQTRWFWGMILSAVALFFYVLYRYRLAQLKKLQMIRNNIASDLHDDIGSTLNSISIYSEVAKQQAGRSIPALDLIGINSRRIVESMSDIVWTINPENDSFERIIVRMRSFAHQLLKAKGIEYTFEADEGLNAMKLSMQVRKNFYLVFKEAVTNLVKYSGATRVSIDMKEEAGTILLRIRDNGKGLLISPETMGNGMMNMKRRAGEIKAVLKIESEKNLGTGVEMKLKL